MASAGRWADAYLEQARADMEGAAAVQGAAPSVFAMLLQMVLEKLGKAALLRSGAIDVEQARTSHAAARRMVQVLGRNPRQCQQLGWRPEVVRDLVAPAVDQLERAQPQLAAGSPCLEYPWEGPDGRICSPATDLALVRRYRVRNIDGLREYRFARDLCERFDSVFPP